MDDKVVLLFLYVIAGALLAALSIPLLRGRIPPNGLYGFRLPKTMGNPEIWYAVNKYAARRLLWAAAVLVLGAVILFFVPGLSLDGYALGCLAIFGVVFGFGLIQSFGYLRTFP